MSGNPFGDNKVTVMVQGDTLPALVRTLKTTAGDTLDLTTAATVKFRLVNKQTGQVAVNDVTATITDAAGGQVTFSAWDATKTGTPGIYDEQWKVDYTASGGTLHIQYPALLTIRPLDDSLYTQSGWLMSLGQAKSFLGARTSDMDPIVSDLIAGVSSAIAGYLNYVPTDATYVHDGSTLKKLDGTGLHTMWLAEKPVTSVSALTIDGVLPAPTVTDPCQFAWYDSGELTFKKDYIFPLGRQNIAVTYRAGYTVYNGSLGAYAPTMPWRITQVAYELLGRKWQEWQRKGPQIQTVQLPQGGGTVTYSLNELSKEQKRMLSPHRGNSFLPQPMPVSRW